ncbi:MAG: rhodanese-like domain-containing protein, partial [Sulfurovum sp.]
DEAIANGDTSKVFDFSNAKTLVMFCNGMWCGQSPASIAALRKFGYPAEKLKYYRGGMQDWHILGLTTVKSPH